MEVTKEIVEKFSRESKYLGNSIIKFDSILNHQVDSRLINLISNVIVSSFSSSKYGKATKIVTAEASGIIPAYGVASNLKIPLIYARKNIPLTMTEGYFSRKIESRTKATDCILCLSKEYLNKQDRILIVDDVLGSGGAISALVSMVRESGAEVIGVACVVEKTFENARASLSSLGIDIVSVVKVDLINDDLAFS